MKNGWKLRDIVLAAVIAVASGAVYMGLDFITGAYTFSPQVGALFNGGWWIAAGLVAFVIRRPGAALFAELVAAICELTFGGTWGWSGVLSGILQGLGAEAAFALFAWKRFTVPVLLLSGAIGGVGNLIQWYLQYGGGTYPVSTQIEYVIITLISGVVLAGVLPCLIARALARTGALRNYAISKAARG